IETIETTRGKVIYQRAEYEPARVYDRALAETMTAMLAAVIRSGTGAEAAIENWPVAGKTGTSQSSRDAWFIGYSSELLGGIWTGNDDDSPMDEVTGGTLPARLWSDMMTVAHKGRTPSLLRGADQLVELTEDQQARVGFYRELGIAFANLAGPSN
ncbi:MAG: penicillin-binding transpeptidase domain-containing protein, partial [Pseudomonadota bacterium]